MRLRQNVSYGGSIVEESSVIEMKGKESLEESVVIMLNFGEKLNKMNKEFIFKQVNDFS